MKSRASPLSRHNASIASATRKARARAGCGRIAPRALGLKAWRTGDGVRPVNFKAMPVFSRAFW